MFTYERLAVHRCSPGGRPATLRSCCRAPPGAFTAGWEKTMRESFGAALHEVGNLLVSMAEAARTQMRQATYALLTADKEAGERVVARDAEINELYAQVEDRV